MTIPYLPPGPPPLQKAALHSLVNVWFDPALPCSDRPHVFGRDSVGNVTIVNSDAGAAAYTGSVIDQAHRAVSELLKIGMRHPE